MITTKQFEANLNAPKGGIKTEAVKAAVRLILTDSVFIK